MFMTVSRANAWFRPCTFCLAVQSQTACSCLSSARRMLATSIRWVRTSQTRRSSLWSQDFGNKGSWISVSSRPAWLCSETIFQKQPTPCGAQQLWRSPCPQCPAAPLHLTCLVGGGSSVQVLFGWTLLVLSCLGVGSVGLGMGRELRERQALNPDWLGL